MRTRDVSHHEPDVAALLVRVGPHTCALKLSQVIEIMRPLKVAALAGAPQPAAGMAVIRGTPVAVVNLAALFECDGGAASRFVIVRAGVERRIALAVDTVLGIRVLASAMYQAMPPLLQHAAQGAVETVGALDSELLFVLNTASLVPHELLQAVCEQKP